MDFDPLHLSEEELNYELALRHIVGLGQTTRRVKCMRLKAALQEEMARGNAHTDLAPVMDDSTNIETCQSRIRLLLPQIDHAMKKQDLGFLEHVKSRLRHYRNRLVRINPPPAEMLDTWTAVHTRWAPCNSFLKQD